MEECIQPMNVLEEAKGEQDIIKLHVTSHSICHKNNKTKQGMMVLVGTEKVIYTILKKAHDPPFKFMQLFKSQVEIINKHGGRSGYQPNTYTDNLTKKYKAENTAYKDANS